jgi:Fur family ferric uptake transcriptional regulator
MKTVFNLFDGRTRMPQGEYRTWQKAAILDYLAGLDGAHTPEMEISDYFRRRGGPIGAATIYRYLEKLVDGGAVKKYTLDETAGACFQYCPEQEGPRDHFHLKCEVCGKLIHLQCGFLDGIQEHVMERHGFSINGAKTVLYGVCPECAE